MLRMRSRILGIPLATLARGLSCALILRTLGLSRPLPLFAFGTSLLVLGSIRQTRALAGPAFYTAMVVLPRHYFEVSSEVELSAMSATIESALERCSMPES